MRQANVSAIWHFDEDCAGDRNADRSTAPKLRPKGIGSLVKKAEAPSAEQAFQEAADLARLLVV